MSCWVTAYLSVVARTTDRLGPRISRDEGVSFCALPPCRRGYFAKGHQQVSHFISRLVTLSQSDSDTAFKALQTQNNSIKLWFFKAIFWMLGWLTIALLYHAV